MAAHQAPQRYSYRPWGWTWVIVALVTIAAQCAILDGASAQQSSNPPTSQGRKITLRDQLVTGLRAFTKADFAFIDQVVLLVQQGKLPRRVVDGTFLWARDRAARRGYTRRLRPMIYFRPALTARAKRVGVTL